MKKLLYRFSTVLLASAVFVNITASEKPCTEARKLVSSHQFKKLSFEEQDTLYRPLEEKCGGCLKKYYFDPCAKAHEAIVAADSKRRSLWEKGERGAKLDAAQTEVENAVKAAQQCNRSVDPESKKQCGE